MLPLALIIFSALCLASLIIVFQSLNKESMEARNNLKRIVTWWVIFAISLTVAYIGNWMVPVFVGALFLVSLYELFNSIYSLSVRLKYALTLIVVSVLLLTLKLEPLYTYTLAFMLFILTLVLKSKSYYFIALVALYFGVTLLSLFHVYQRGQSTAVDGSLLFLAILLLTSLNDIAQYVVGNLVGKSSLAPVLSPGKTIEGALGGVIITALASGVLLTWVLGIAWYTAASMGCCIAIAGIAGDLYVSRLKRQSGVKESGKLLPGHGGLLDRIDSLLTVAPTFGLILAFLP